MKMTRDVFRFLLCLIVIALAAPRAHAQSAGNVDPGFDPGAGPSNPIYALAVQADGKIIIAGNFLYLNGYTVNGFARLNADGTIDFTFNPAGGADQRILAVALQPDGKVLIGGAFTAVNGFSRSGLARLNADGSVDDTFGYYAGANDVVRGIALQGDGQILVTGDFTAYNNNPFAHVARLNGYDGSLDFSFYPGQGASAAVGPVVVQPDGNILLGGNFLGFDGTFAPGLVRLDAAGTLDTTFGAGGSPYPNNYVDALLVQPDGKILVGGGFTGIGGAARNGVARLNADGTLDAGFYDPAGGPDGAVLALGLQADGNVIIGGEFTGVDGIDGGSIARLTPNGVLDLTYGPGFPANGAVTAVQLLPDGETLAGGAFTSIGGVTRDFVARLFQSPTANPTTAVYIRLLSLTGKQFDANSTVELTADANSPGDPITSLTLYNNDAVTSQADFTSAQPVTAAGRTRRDAPFQQSFSKLGALIASGLNNLKVIATTQSGAKITSNVSAVTGMTATGTASCQITSPAAGGIPAAGTPVQINVQKAGQAVTVEFYVDSAKGGLNQVQPADQSTAMFTLPALSTDRAHTLTAVVTDNMTGVSQQSTPVVLTPAVAAVPPPSVTVSVPGGGTAATTSGRGPAVKLRITRTAASGNAADLDLSQPLTVTYKAKGSAKAGVNFKPLSRIVTIPAGAASGKLKIKPIDDGGSGSTVLKIKVLPSADGGYTAGAAVAKVRIEGD